MKIVRLRVLFIVSEDWYFVSHRLSLARAAKIKGHEVAVLTRISKHRELIESSGLTVINWPIDRSSVNIVMEIRALWVLVATIWRYSPHLIHSVALKPILYSAIACNFANVEGRIFALGGLGYVFNSKKCLARVLRPFINFFFCKIFSNERTRVIVQNTEDYKRLASLRNMQVEKIYLIKGAGVDTEAFSPAMVTYSPLLVVMHARLLFSKGIEDFVWVAENLKAKGIVANFMIAGDRDIHNPECIPSSKIEGWIARGVVEFCGYQENAVSFLNKASVVCFPSYSEGLPKSLLEAASCALPIVAYDIPGCREVVEDCKNGYLVPLGERAELAMRVEQLLCNPRMRKEMGQIGRLKAVTQFSQEKISLETMQVWQEVVS